MGYFTVIRPQDDAVTEQCAVWAEDFIHDALRAAHHLDTDLDGAQTPTHRSAVLAAVQQAADLVLYFGHGDYNCWLTEGQPTITTADVSAFADKAVVSIACKTSSILAGAAITGGATAWLGWTSRFPVLPPHLNVDSIGETLNNARRRLSAGETMQSARDYVRIEFEALAGDFDSGPLASQPNAMVGYLAALVIRDHVVVHGDAWLAPLRLKGEVA